MILLSCRKIEKQNILDVERRPNKPYSAPAHSLFVLVHIHFTITAPRKFQHHKTRPSQYRLMQKCTDSSAAHHPHKSLLRGVQ